MTGVPRDNIMFDGKPYAWLWLVIVVACGCNQRELDPAPLSSTSASTASATHWKFARSPAFDQLAVTYRNGEEAQLNAILESLGGGVGLLDYDADGWLDLCISGGGTLTPAEVQGLPTFLVRQHRPGEFAHVASLARLTTATHYSHGVTAADFNNDGFVDLLITGYGGVQLWSNLGDGTFYDTTAEAQLLDRSWSSSAAAGDFNRDGVPDLYIAHYVNWSLDNNPPCNGPQGSRDVCPPRQFEGVDDVLYLGQGDGTFVDATATAGLVAAGKGLGVIVWDADLDGDSDIYVANDTVPNFYYANDGHGHFREEGLACGLGLDDMSTPNGSMGVAVTDFNADGLPDLWVTNYEDELFGLYKNLGQGVFQHVSRRSGLNRLGTLFVGFGCIAGDFDADGDEDVAVANGHVVHHPRNAPVQQQSLLLENTGQGQFERVPAEELTGNFSQPAISRGVASGDFNRDGLLDLVFVNTNTPAQLLENHSLGGSGSSTETTIPSGLRVRLIGRDSTRDAIGAWAELKTSQGTQTRYLYGGGSYLSTSESVLSWYWPAKVAVTELTVHWPSGQVSQLQVHAPTNGGVLAWTLTEPLSDAD